MSRIRNTGSAEFPENFVSGIRGLEGRILAKCSVVLATLILFKVIVPLINFLSHLTVKT